MSKKRDLTPFCLPFLSPFCLPPGTPNAIPLQLTYSYDAVGNVTHTADNYGVAVTATFDSRYLLTSQSWNGPGISARATMSYDPRGARTDIRRFADLIGTQQIGRSESGYNVKGHLTSIQDYNAIDGVFSDLTLFYDDADQLSQKTVNQQATNYAYDQSGQLTGADHTAQADELYGYDATGNRTSGGQTIGAGNRLQSDSQYAYSWGPEGNLVSRVSLTDDSVTAWTYDHRNRLTQVSQRTATGIVTQQTDFTYDVFDRRIARTADLDGAGPALPTSTTFLYDGDHVWADGDGAGNITARYLYGDGIDDLLARHRVSDGTAWYLTDQVGSVHAIVNAAGTVIDQIVYDSFGNVLSETNAAAGDRFKFTSREWDSETGLYYSRARYYSPSLGIFISQDPIGFAGGDTNLNRYVGNSPLMYSDPFGLTAMVETSLVSDAGKRAASAFAAGTIGYACGYLEAWYNHDPNPALAAAQEAVVGATVGAVLGWGISHLPGMYQLTIGIAFAIQAVTSGEDYVIKGLRGACLIAEFATGGAFKNVKHALDNITPPKSLDDWAKTLKRFLGSESGGMPIGQRGLVRPTLPGIPKRFARGFDGPVRVRTFKAGERIHRSPWVPDELPDNPGSWFGTRPTATKSGTDSMYQIDKFDNPNEVLRSYEFTRDVSVYYGKVRGGTGFQVLFPKDVTPGSVLKYLGENPLK